MRANRRTAAASAGALLLMTAAATADPDHHGKTIQQCNAELRAGRAALVAAGESAAKFIHDCWWRTKAGQPTPIAGAQATKADDTAAKLKKADDAIAKARAEADAAKADAARARQEAAEARKAIAAAEAPMSPPERKPASAVAPPRAAKAARIQLAGVPAVAPRVHVARRLVDRRVFVPPRIVGYRPREVADRRPSPLRIRMKAQPIVAARSTEGETAKPLVEWVPVHIATAARPVRWPVFPEFVPPFRYAVNHPIVPGFTWTP